MTPSKRKGTAAETRFVRYLCSKGLRVERRALNGSKDRGDVAGLPGVVLEIKNAKRIELAGWMDEVVLEKANDMAERGFLIFPRRNCATGRAYVVQELDQFIEQEKELNELRTFFNSHAKVAA